ncbi:MAG TPA: 50S ribosomal protein L5 [Nitrospiria bacterium]|nr:50S ribosomal protein L5 [Nitrospiria bacterium]
MAKAREKAKPEKEKAPKTEGREKVKGKEKAKPAPEEVLSPRLKVKYRERVVPDLMKQFSYKNPMQVPRLEKVVINVGMGEAIQNAKLLEAAVNELTLITGQKPVVTRAKKSISGFKLRQGMAIGCKVTLRGGHMYEFLDRFFNVALPRIRDFKGVSPKSFDGRGNYSMGLKEQLLFPEIKYDDVVATHGMDITIATTARSNDEGKALLGLLGLPFRT